MEQLHKDSSLYILKFIGTHVIKKMYDVSADYASCITLLSVFEEN